MSRRALLMEQFRQGEVKAADVLDVDKFARRHAIIDLVGGHHSVDWSDVKFYFNPQTGKIEPVMYESFSAYKINRILGSYRYVREISYLYDFHHVLFTDPDFFKSYVGHLERLSEQAYMDSFLARNRVEMLDQQAILHSEFFYQEIDTTIYYFNQDIIRRTLDVPQSFHAYYEGIEGDTLSIKLGSIASFPTSIRAVQVNDGEWISLDEELILSAKLPRSYLGIRGVYDAGGGVERNRKG